MRTFEVTLPIAGHAYVLVEAETEAQAIDAALDKVELRHIETWEALKAFNTGNICHCPTPWKASAADETPDDEDA